ncbi:MAG: flagellar hook-associated protein FlgL, partial [Planctomycetota bacterium JB042]
MTIRTTPLALYTRTLHDLQRTYGRLAQAQVDVSSGKRLRVVSDDPADAARALNTRNSLRQTLQARESISNASFATQTQAEVLESLSSVLTAARAKAEGAANGINSPTELKTYAAELDGFLQELVAKANTELEGRYLFSGSKVHTPPIQTQGPGGKISSVLYAGDDLTRSVRVGPFETKPIDVSGRSVFFTPDRGPTVLAGPSGLKTVPGASDTLVGSAELVVAHTATTLGDGALGVGGDAASGLQPGASTASDTIVGPHTVSVFE